MSGLFCFPAGRLARTEKTAAPFWTINRTLAQGFLFAVTGEPSNAVEMITSGIAALRATGYTHSMHSREVFREPRGLCTDL
jgi:hypothetical protein